MTGAPEGVASTEAYDTWYESTAAGARMLPITLDVEGHGIGKLLVALLVRLQAEAGMPRNLERLKDRLEARC